MTLSRIFSFTIAFLLLLPPIILANNDSPARDGEIIASIGFDPKIHGFGFRNFGKNPDFDEDLTEDDLIRIFGAENVCIEGSTSNDCVLYETADRWIEETIEKMNGGHCDGFSVSSLRMFVGRPFKGRKKPSDFQRGAVNLFDLKKDQLTSNYVSFYQTLTFLKETYLWRTPTFKKKPSEILQMIEDSMETKKELYTLEVWMKEAGKYTRGHSILPIAIEEMDDEGIYRIHVYDNNYPGQTKYVTINTKTETWRYHTANNPAETARDYVGNAASNTLALKRLSDRAKARYECPFCDEDEGDTDGEASVFSSRVPTFMNASFVPGARKQAQPDTINISTSGDVDLMIGDANGKRIGYDPVKKVTLNEIPGAVENLVAGDGEIDNAPEYLLPLNPANKKPYKISVHGTDSEYMSDLQVYGPGFVVGFEDISVDKGESLNMTVSQDGRELSFTASADGETPSLYIATDSGENKPSYEFEIGGITLRSGKTVSMKLDPDKGLIYFKDDDGDEDKYDVVISRTNPNGKVDVFEEYDMDIGDKNTYVLNFGAWNGKGGICAKDDEDEDGSYDDEECTEIEDEKPVK
ncbi:MAG TPA: hypothetical protein PLP21_11215 [Pyrinomonadaceae bacterium]|nr:hypothetical protein [Acidobacteriota bacterium]HQZ96878.1 hypothetical protein [Pyrinomonadaceae bacterium]